MKFFTTRYALTSGISEIESDDIDEDGVVCDGVRHVTFYYLGRDCFLDRAEAVAKATSMRDAKIKSLRTKIEKLSAMRFL